MSLTTAFLCTIIAVGTFLSWELVAWFTHKFIMHGFLWSWHRSHHSVHDKVLERNDLFALVFSMPSIGLFYYYSLEKYNPYMLAVAAGILCYGVFYFIFHDIVVHQRLRWKVGHKNRYLQRMIHAHYVHHSKHTRDGCEAFGFLIVPKKYEPKDFVLRKNRSETQ